MHRDRDEEWELRVSASQQTVLLNYSKQHWKQHQNASRFVVLDGNSFEVKQTWNLSPALHSKLYSVSDHAIAVDSHLKPPEHIFMSEFGEDRWTPIWQKARPCNTWAVLALIRDNSFVYGCKEFYFVAAGRITMKEEFGRSEEPVSGKISVTPDGRLVAISLRQLKGGFFDTERYTKALHVVVYDLFLKKRVLTMVIAPLPKNDYDFALSPDGSKLAILNDRNVSVCSVPAPGNSTK